MRDTSFAVWRYRFACLAAFMTFPLILVGGLVTSKDAGMAVPDWPSTFGYNMFTYPWAKMVGPVLYEHGHRLLGSLVGFLTLSLALWVGLREPRRWVRWVTFGALFAVCLQGVMGGLRVTLVNTASFGHWAILFAIVHGCFAQAFVVLIGFTAYIQSAEWHRGPLRLAATPESAEAVGARLLRVRRLALSVAGLLLIQLALGALLRHINRFAHLHMAFALVATAGVLWLWRVGRRDAEGVRRVTEITGLLPWMVGAQVSLGVTAWLALPDQGYFRELDSLQLIVPTAHQALGALLLLGVSFVAIRSWRFEVVVDAPAPTPTPLAAAEAL